MVDFGHVKRVTRSVGGKEITFRSKLEYRYAEYLQLLQETGEIQAWDYESESVILKQPYHRNKREYLPDFWVLVDGEWEIHETKGYFPPKDYTKLKMTADQYDNKVVLIFASMAENPKSAKIRAQKNRALRLEPHIHRIIWNANRDIFKKISFRFDE